ncbi:MAG TPA: hypothetical protein VMB50_03990 [Myxococcales bacterium]|nr:hypothetical protein [Myxococcales bacterium]
MGRRVGLLALSALEMCVTGGTFYPAPQGSLQCVAVGSKVYVCETGAIPDGG